MNSIRIVFHVENAETGEVVIDASKIDVDLSDAKLTQAEIETLARMELGPDSEAAKSMRIGKRAEMFKAVGLVIDRAIAAKVLPLPTDPVAQ
jgi:hypothetical protein